MTTNEQQPHPPGHCNCPLYTSYHFDWSCINPDATVLIIGGRCTGRSSRALQIVSACCAPSDPCIIHHNALSCESSTCPAHSTDAAAVPLRITAHALAALPPEEQVPFLHVCMDAPHIALIYDDVDLYAYDEPFMFPMHPHKLTIVVAHNYTFVGRSRRVIPFHFDYIVLQRPCGDTHYPLHVLYKQCALKPYLSFDVLLHAVKQCIERGESLIIHKTLDVHTRTSPPSCKQLYSH